MPDNLGDLIKRYVREALTEYFREVWGELPETERPYPFWPFGRESLRRSRELTDRLEQNVASLGESVSFLHQFSLQARDWSPRCSERDNIATLQKELATIKASLDGLNATLGKMMSASQKGLGA